MTAPSVLWSLLPTHHIRVAPSFKEEAYFIRNAGELKVCGRES